MSMRMGVTTGIRVYCIRVKWALRILRGRWPRIETTQPGATLTGMRVTGCEVIVNHLDSVVGDNLFENLGEGGVFVASYGSIVDVRRGAGRGAGLANL